ncbi:MAG: hypothetical protein AAF515_09235 [Pseudomonadota bacterium]
MRLFGTGIGVRSALSTIGLALLLCGGTAAAQEAPPAPAFCPPLTEAMDLVSQIAATVPGSDNRERAVAANGVLGGMFESFCLGGGEDDGDDVPTFATLDECIVYIRAERGVKRKEARTICREEFGF